MSPFTTRAFTLLFLTIQVVLSQNINQQIYYNGLNCTESIRITYYQEGSACTPTPCANIPDFPNKHKFVGSYITNCIDSIPTITPGNYVDTGYVANDPDECPAKQWNGVTVTPTNYCWLYPPNTGPSATIVECNKTYMNQYYLYGSTNCNLWITKNEPDNVYELDLCVNNTAFTCY